MVHSSVCSTLTHNERSSRGIPRKQGHMLTRLRVSGFKNLVDVDVRFGPFTCIAGANAAGKSNLFDAIRFLSLLADQRLRVAAGSIRDDKTRKNEIRDLFTQINEQNLIDEMAFEADMLIPSTGQGELDQTASATTTVLRYALKLKFLGIRADKQLQILHEELIAIPSEE